MGNPTYTGATYSELATGWQRDPRNGLSMVRSYHGKFDALSLLETSAAENGRRTMMDPQPDGSYVLRVQYGAEDTQDTNEPLATVWELVGNDMEKELWTLPEVKRVMDIITTVHGKAVIRKLIEDWVKGDVEAELDNGETLTLNEANIRSMANLYGITSTNDQTILIELANNLVQGVQSWTISQFVVRRTVTIASNAGDSLKPAYDNVNKVMDDATFNATESPPATLKFRIPEGYFLKRTPTVRQVAADKWEVVNEWWHADDYSELIYEQV